MVFESTSERVQPCPELTADVVRGHCGSGWKCRGPHQRVCRENRLCVDPEEISLPACGAPRGESGPWNPSVEPERPLLGRIAMPDHHQQGAGVGAPGMLG